VGFADADSAQDPETKNLVAVAFADDQVELIEFVQPTKNLATRTVEEETEGRGGDGDATVLVDQGGQIEEKFQT